MSLKIIKAGLADSIQDAGRNGYRHLGINPGGPMDRFSAQLANALLGKALNSPLLELSFPASAILWEAPTILCISGGNFTPVLNGQAIRLHQPVFVPANSLLEFRQVQYGRWCYVALVQELQAEHWLGSYSTNTKIGAGGYKGRTLQSGDRILFKDDMRLIAPIKNRVEPLPWQAKATINFNRQELHLIKGPEWSWLTADARQLATTQLFRLAPQSDRMGYRLQATALKMINETQLVSSAVCAGTLQLPPNGQLIALMADHQTTGGYPRIGQVITADVPILAQQQPGQSIRFSLVEVADAEQRFIRQQKYLQQLQIACTFNMQNYVHASLRPEL